jgi:HEPN domain-containing protein
MDSADLEPALATVYELLHTEGMCEAAEIVRRYPSRLEQTGYDNWNGGTNIWEIYLDVPATDYAKLGPKRINLEEQISARLKTVLEPENQDWYSIKLIPAKSKKKEWRKEVDSPLEVRLPRQTRQNILDGLRIDGVAWSGVLDEVEFLGRIFDLKALPSSDARYKDAAGDIWQHRVNNDDWDNDWIFSDSRFNLLDGPHEIFLRFLCEILNPVIRADRDEALKLANHFNDQLRPVGLEIYEEERIAGRPRFAYRQLTHNGKYSVLRARTVADALDAGWMARAIERLENAIDTDPDLAIGTAKELVESCCKTILTKRGIPISKSSDLSDLTKALTKELQLVPEGITDEAKGAENIRLILRNLMQLTNNLAQLRGLYGTGHGRDGKHRGLQPRHARLAAASAVAFIDFVAETFRHREAIEQVDENSKRK